MTAPWRVGLIGYGYWGPNLLRNLRAHPRCAVRRVADRDPEARARLGQLHPPVDVADDGAAVIDDPEIDVVVIATEASSHFALVDRALRAGKHVLVEKPLATSTADARALRALADERERLLMVGHTFLYNPAVLRLRELLDAGELGDLRYLYGQRLNLGKVRSDIGVIWNLGPHDVSILLYLLPDAPVVAVRAHTTSFLQPGIEDVAFLLIELADGVLCHVHLSWLDPRKVRQLTVVGSRKMVVYDDVAKDRLQIYDKGIERADLSPHMGEFASFGEFQLLTRTGDLSVPHLPAVEPLAAEVAHLLECLDSGRAPRSDAAHGVEVVAVLEAALASAAAGGQWIRIDGAATLGA